MARKTTTTDPVQALSEAIDDYAFELEHGIRDANRLKLGMVSIYLGSALNETMKARRELVGVLARTPVEAEDDPTQHNPNE